MNKLCAIVALWPFMVFGQSFAPAPGFPGSTAIYKDSSSIVNWASGVVVTRGPMDLQNSGSGPVSYGVDADGTGMADVQPVSLGDGGEAVLTFPWPITNGPGPDFAVFENGFADHYIELAHVEVSSDGVNFFRFPGISEAPTDVQLTNFSFSDCGYYHNLAGKYRQEYGTPFDLEEMNGIPGLDIEHVTHVRLIDVVGSIDGQYGTVDSQGNLINDPFPTAFESGGFDLDAVAVLHETHELGQEEMDIEVQVYPNPVQDRLHLNLGQPARLKITDAGGYVLFVSELPDNGVIDLSELSAGMYLLHLEGNAHASVRRIIKL